jgi:hypothetical protein
MPWLLCQPVIADTLAALKELPNRDRQLGAQIDRITERIDELVSAANPALRAARGVGQDTAA